MPDVDDELAILRERIGELEARLLDRQDEADGSTVYAVQVVPRPDDATQCKYEIVNLSGSEAPGAVPTVTGTGAYLFDAWYSRPAGVANGDLILAASTADGRWVLVGKAL